MQVARWGNSLAVRLPAALVRELGLAEGDEVVLRAADARTLEVAREMSRDEALEELKRLREGVRLPSDYKFDREALWLGDDAAK